MQNSNIISNIDNEAINDKNEKQDRIIFLDVLRILATIAVICIHVVAQNLNNINITAFEWNVFNIFDSISRWAVPVFVMISGTLFLDNNKKIDVKKIYRSNILRIITAFIFWSFIYISLANITLNRNYNILEYIYNIIEGPEHLWFLYMIVGLYLIIPILRKITEDTKITEYFLIISLIFTFIIPSILKFPRFTNFIKINNNMGVYITLGYSSYFILGYWLNKKNFSLKQIKVIYFLSILGFCITILGNIIMKKNNISSSMVNSFYPNILLESIGIFIFFKSFKFQCSTIIKKVIYKVSKYSFGIYLVHALIIAIIKKIGINTLSFNPILSVPTIIILTFFISLIISKIINNIPILKKYIV